MSPRRIVIQSGASQARPSDPYLFVQPSGGHDIYFVRMRRIWRPPTDVYETEDRVIVKVEIAGMDEGELEISFANGRLIVSGERHDQATRSGRLTYQNMEIHYGEFRSEVAIVARIEESAIEASYERGFLYVELPKAQPHRIAIKTVDGGRDAESSEAK